MERILLAAPRGFCAGVAFAIEVVDLALRAYGTPLYVRHAIVHNESVVRSFEARGVIFVEEIAAIPPGSPVVFSAHGVSPAVRAEAAARGLIVVDATCPLVTKVHNEARRYAARGYSFAYIGHRGHVEAEGTMGEAPDRMTLVETPAEAERVELPDGPLVLLTQTTLSVEEVREITAILERRFPRLERPAKEDICYATTNRQGAVRELARRADLVLVVGSPQSSNSNRLREVAAGLGAQAHLLMSVEEIEPEWTDAARIVGVTSGASTPENLVEDVVGELVRRAPEAVIETIETVREDLSFTPSRDLIALARAG